MKKIILHKLILMMLILSLANITAAQALQGEFDSPSAEFLEWQKNLNTENEEASSSILNRTALPSSVSTSYRGITPIPVDLSHLASNPPVEETGINRRAEAIPSKYDLRNVNGTSYVPAVKNQLPYGTCWAFAAIGAMESNFMRQGYSEIDLSEAHMSYFTFRNANKSKTFMNMSTSASFYTIMMNGGNSFYPVAMLSRLDAPTSEAEVPYGENLKPSKSTPESYTRVMRLRDAYFLSMTNEQNFNASESLRNAAKRRIMENGAVVANFYHTDSGYQRTASGGTAFYTSTRASTNHAIQVVGWDDNYSRNNFKKKPSIDGAWLIKNSWGDEWYIGNDTDVGDNGYFWISYANNLTEGTSFIVEEANPDLKAYYYDSLGWCGNYGSDSGTYAANVFLATRDDEKLVEIGLYTPDNNINYEIKVYTNLGRVMPSSSPVMGSPALTDSGTISTAGYHTITLPYSVELTNGQFFSVVVYYKNSKAPMERVMSGFSNNAVIEDGSFYSLDGRTWEKGSVSRSNPCIKAFTVTGAPLPTPAKITTSYPPDGFLGKAYSSELTASGTSPITWSVSGGNFPNGLSLSSEGVISGTPTREGSFTYYVTASNSIGSDTKCFTTNIWDLPVVTAKSFTGYVGYSFSGKLELSESIYTTWSTTSSLPAGLKLNPTTGAITGTPTKAGTYTVSVSAVTAIGTSTGTVTFTINPKPVKPSITTASLTNAVVFEEYSQALKYSGTEPITFTADGLPEGLNFNTSTANFSGTPQVSGTYTVKITAENIATELSGGTPVTKNIKFTIKGQVPEINAPVSLDDAVMNKAYDSYQFTTSKGSAPITWTASGLPSGMTFSTSGLLSGTPKKAGTFNITFKASNSAGNKTVKLKLIVIQPPAFTSKTLTNATTDKKYTATLKASGTAPISWDIQGLPETLSYSINKTGTIATITGTPVAAETYDLNVKITNSADTIETPVTLKVNGVAPTLTVSLKKGIVDSVYSGDKITAKGTKPIEITYSIAASDAAKFGISDLSDIGLTLSVDTYEGTAHLIGTPSMSVKNLPVTFSASNIASTRPVTKKANLTVAGEKPSFISHTSSTVNVLQAVNSEVDMSFTVTGTKNITITASGLSNNLSFEQTGDYSGRLYGTASSKDGKQTITITASNADGTATRKIYINTKTPPAITTTSLADGKIKTSYNYTLSASGTKSIKWELTAGTLPEGIKLYASTGVIKGKPTEAGDFTFTVTASNDIGTDSKEFTLTIADPNNNTALPDAPDSEYDEAETSYDEPENETPNAVTAAPSYEPEASITFGSDRNVEALTREEISMLETEGYIIAAVLPEVKAIESGMYDIEAELDENVEAGRKLYWFAFPRDAEKSEDDEIAEFYDTEGAEILTVPESHKVIVSVWLNEGITYAPVIAVK